MQSLSIRGSLSRKDENYYNHLVKGFEGECTFDEWVEDSLKEHILLGDLIFKVNGTIFQLDSLVITNQKLYLYEVKNYEGEFQMDMTSLKRYQAGPELLNPLIQLQRSTILFKQLMDQMNIKIPIESYVIFINKNFTLYQSEPHPQILVCSQLERHFESIKDTTYPLSEKCLSLSKSIMKKQLDESPYQDLPDYSIENLSKGIYCSECFNFIEELTGRLCVCSHCGYRETAYDNTYRHIVEFTRLFPEKQLTTQIIYKWCNGLHSMYRIRSVLRQELAKNENTAV